MTYEMPLSGLTGTIKRIEINSMTDRNDEIPCYDENYNLVLRPNPYADAHFDMDIDFIDFR